MPSTAVPYILVQKAKDYLSFMPMDRDGVREVFVEAIEANADDPDVDFINIYFNELTTDTRTTWSRRIIIWSSTSGSLPCWTR